MILDNKQENICMNKNPIEADIVIGVPDSGVPAAIGYAEASGIPYSAALLKNKICWKNIYCSSSRIKRKSSKS